MLSFSILRAKYIYMRLLLSMSRFESTRGCYSHSKETDYGFLSNFTFTSRQHDELL